MTIQARKHAIDLEKQGDLLVLRVRPELHLSAREKIDLWADTCLDIIRQHPVGKPLFFLNDVTYMDYGLYGARRAEGVFRTLPLNMTGALVTVYPRRSMKLFSEAFVSPLLSSRLPYLNLRVCADYESAFNWISDLMGAVRV